MTKTNGDRGSSRRYGSHGGFTLIELMIVIMIISILVSIAYPSYLNQMRSSRRAEGQTLLLEAQSKQERFFTENNSYGSIMFNLGYGVAGNNSESTENGWYLVSAAVTPGGCAPGTATPCTGFTLSAAPQNDQAKDAECATLTINHLGVKGELGTGTAADCW